MSLAKYSLAFVLVVGAAFGAATISQEREASDKSDAVFDSDKESGGQNDEAANTIILENTVRDPRNRFDDGFRQSFNNRTLISSMITGGSRSDIWGTPPAPVHVLTCPDQAYKIAFPVLSDPPEKSMTCSVGPHRLTRAIEVNGKRHDRYRMEYSDAPPLENICLHDLFDDATMVSVIRYHCRPDGVQVRLQSFRETMHRHYLIAVGVDQVSFIIPKDNDFVLFTMFSNVLHGINLDRKTLKTGLGCDAFTYPCSDEARAAALADHRNRIADQIEARGDPQ